MADAVEDDSRAFLRGLLLATVLLSLVCGASMTAVDVFLRDANQDDFCDFVEGSGGLLPINPSDSKVMSCEPDLVYMSLLLVWNVLSFLPLAFACAAFLWFFGVILRRIVAGARGP